MDISSNLRFVAASILATSLVVTPATAQSGQGETRHQPQRETAAAPVHIVKLVAAHTDLQRPAQIVLQ